MGGGSTSTLSELFSAINKLSGLFNITTCNSFAVSDNSVDYMNSGAPRSEHYSVDYMTSGAPRTEHYQLASNKLGFAYAGKDN